MSAPAIATVRAWTFLSLRVEGYRSLPEVTVDFGQIAVVVGPSGSGKTNIYRALRLAQACADGRLARTIVQEGGMSSTVYAGSRTGEPKVELAVDLLTSLTSFSWRPRAHSTHSPETR
jgi:predicted ATPase